MQKYLNICKISKKHDRRYCVSKRIKYECGKTLKILLSFLKRTNVLYPPELKLNSTLVIQE